MKDLDRMAMAAMQGTLSSLTNEDAEAMLTVSEREGILVADLVARISYIQAEAMLAESKKRSSNEPLKMD